ncbi:hypothetical protein MYMA111404_00020 [Mycoplasma marinum]|uniref:Variable surface lipoprotein n=1 Tax=Mycoplasma marinum TaxID=1937190 RepID=A0A4R0XV35_9MOLU|nr:hypothetical protein [Mycoplasma marinum]TCG11690.1 hypothetical protein C4B24_00865 [Mycoplasma marinum]
MKKIIIKSFGVLVSVVLPLVAITSCGDTTKDSTNHNQTTPKEIPKKQAPKENPKKPIKVPEVKKTWVYPKITDQGSREIVNKWINPFIASEAKKYIDNKTSVFGPKNSFDVELKDNLKKQVLQEYENKKTWDKWFKQFKDLFFWDKDHQSTANKVAKLDKENKEFHKEWTYFTGGWGNGSEITINHFGSFGTSIKDNTLDFVSGIGMGDTHHLWEASNMQTIKDTTISGGTFDIYESLAFDAFKAKKEFSKFCNKWNLSLDQYWGKKQYWNGASIDYKKDALVNWTDLYDYYMLHK